MNIEALKKVLDREGIKPIYYSLNGIREVQEVGAAIGAAVLDKKGKNGFIIFMSVVVNLTLNILIQKMKLVNICFND